VLFQKLWLFISSTVQTFGLQETSFEENINNKKKQDLSQNLPKPSQTKDLDLTGLSSYMVTR